jgi:DNA-binding transcriptional ArsR family regulator
MVEYPVAGLDRTYQALCHPVRREMLTLLRTSATRVTELARPFDVSLAAASKHITVLERAGLISRSVSGRDHLLSLDARPLAPARIWIDTYRSFWESRFIALEAHLQDGRRS